MIRDKRPESHQMLMFACLQKYAKLWQTQGSIIPIVDDDQEKGYNQSLSHTALFGLTLVCGQANIKIS